MMSLTCRVCALIVLVSVAAFAQGCSRMLMVTPSIFDAGEVDPFFELTPAQRTNLVTIFYATDRLENTPGEADYGRRRSDTLDVGTCEVQIGGDDGWSRLVQLTTAGPHPAKPSVRLAHTHRMGDLFSTRRVPMPEPTPAMPDQTAVELLAQLNTTIKQSAHQEVTVFIHGFNTGFAEAVMSCAEYAHYAGNQGAFVCYTWPSYDSLWRYQHDLDSARYTGTHLRQFVLFLAEHTDAKKINFVCHSLGCQVFGTLLRELRLVTNHLSPDEARASLRIGQVFLIAPDLNVDVARERVLEEGSAELFDNLTIYSSKFDYALRYAAQNLYYYPRLGSLGRNALGSADILWLNALDNVTIVDIDGHPTRTLIGHMHQRYNPAVSSDILLMLRRDLTPGERALTRDPEELIWRFDDDYETRIRAAAKMVYPPRVQGSD